MLNLQGGEILLLIVIALVVLGPERLPEYAAKLAHGVQRLREMAEGAKTQIKDEMGPAFEDVDWRRLDPRQYDPRRIVRDALSGTGPPPPAGSGAAASPHAPAQPPEAVGRRSRSGLGPVRQHDPSRPTPFDVDAT